MITPLLYHRTLSTSLFREAHSVDNVTAHSVDNVTAHSVDNVTAHSVDNVTPTRSINVVIEIF